MKVEMKVMTWTQTEDGNTQGGGRKTMEAFTNGRNVTQSGREERIAANTNKTYKHTHTHIYIYIYIGTEESYGCTRPKHVDVRGTSRRATWRSQRVRGLNSGPSDYKHRSSVRNGRERHDGGPYDIVDMR